jgi:hypothetical protein
METSGNIPGNNDSQYNSTLKPKVSGSNLIQRLYGKRVAISVSESEDLEQLGLSVQHLQDISIEIARYLIVNGAKLLYGGDLRKGGFTELFSELSYQYKYLVDKESRFINYFPYPNARNLSVKEKAVFMQKQVELRLLGIPPSLRDLSLNSDFDPLNNVEDRYYYAECLSHLRAHMTNDCDARIVLGGIQKNYKGYFPGIIEESFYTLKAYKAIYLLGGFGGAAKTIIEIISGINTNKNIYDHLSDSEIHKKIRMNENAGFSVKVDPEFLTNFLQNYTVEKIADHNGLSVEENLILFESTNIHELIYLIIKGLSNMS